VTARRRIYVTRAGRGGKLAHQLEAEQGIGGLLRQGFNHRQSLYLQGLVYGIELGNRERYCLHWHTSDTQLISSRELC
jgi:hypothetical protein